jgi:hypothetical protein
MLKILPEYWKDIMDDFVKAWIEMQNAITVLPSVEYRIYYDPISGKILDYTTEHHEGTYILVDKETFAQHRFEYKIKNGQLTTPKTNIGKLRPGNTGIPCHPADITIIVDDNNAQHWKNHTYDN